MNLPEFSAWRTALTHIHEGNFDEMALKLFTWQGENNPLYKSYLTHLGVKPHEIKRLADIPFLPIRFFKDYVIKTGQWQEETVFKSSGTTGMQRSKHYVDDIAFYQNHAENIFRSFYGDMTGYHMLALLPSYQEQGNSSLINMVQHLITHSAPGLSGFYKLDDIFFNAIKEAMASDKEVMIWGVTFSLMDWAEQSPFDISGTTIIETGGMKGRRIELTRSEAHDFLKNKLRLKHIHTEYGMTELLSQAYALQDGRFVASNSLKIIVKEINDPFSAQALNKLGVINIVDLANIHSCAFIETEDIGHKNEDGTFEILGRLDNSEIRGCNLLAT